jgi:hypothetical protein
MKTLSRTFVFVVAAVVAIVIVLRLGGLAMASHGQTAKGPYKFTLTIRGQGNDEYAELKDQDHLPQYQQKFDDILKGLAGHGEHNIRFLCKEGMNPDDPYDPQQPEHHHMCIKTDKVTTSEVAKNTSAGESVANDPNVTRFLSSNNATDIKAALDLFK